MSHCIIYVGHAFRISKTQGVVAVDAFEAMHLMKNEYMNSAGINCVIAIYKFNPEHCHDVKLKKQKTCTAGGFVYKSALNTI